MFRTLLRQLHLSEKWFEQQFFYPVATQIFTEAEKKTLQDMETSKLELEPSENDIE